MKKFNEIKTNEELRQFVEKVVGEGKECEKNLLTAVSMFLLHYCPEDERDVQHVINLLEATKVPRNIRNAISDLDIVMEQVSVIEPNSLTKMHYEAYKMYPESVVGQSAGNLIYKLSSFVENERKEKKAKEEPIHKVEKELTSKAQKNIIIERYKKSYIVDHVDIDLFKELSLIFIKGGYDVRVFSTSDIKMSNNYNPLEYIKTDDDVAGLVSTLLKSTGDSTGDFADAEKLLLMAIILFLIHYCPKTEHDFLHVMQLLVAADRRGTKTGKKSDLDKMFDQVERMDPHGLALKTYERYKKKAGENKQGVLASLSIRLSMFNYPEIERLTSKDTVDLTAVGNEKTILFIVEPQLDNGFGVLTDVLRYQLKILNTDSYIHRKRNLSIDDWMQKQIIPCQKTMRMNSFSKIVL